MASVKDFRVGEKPAATDLGRGRFIFSDRYPAFGWGGMPDHVPNRGASLCLMGAYSFELLDVNHAPTHYLGVVEDGKVKELDECESPPAEMAIELAQMPDLPHADGAYNYDAYHKAAGDNYLIPLEVVFRSIIPVGSNLQWHGELAGYGLELDERSDEAVSLPESVVEFSTRYEEQDRYLSCTKVGDIAGRVDLDRFEKLVFTADHMLTERADEASFDHEGGKIECLYHNDTVKVGGVVGTFDENRFLYSSQQVLKEVVRQYHKRVQPEWIKAVKDVKTEVIETGGPNWRERRAIEPDRLSADIVEALSDLYCVGTNAYVDHDWFDASTIEDAVVRVRSL